MILFWAKQDPEPAFINFPESSQSKKVFKDNFLRSRSEILPADFGAILMSLLQVPPTSLINKWGHITPTERTFYRIIYLHTLVGGKILLGRCLRYTGRSTGT